jgi:hypothetical protein
VEAHDCTACGASIAAGAQWCSLCYAPVAVPAQPGSGVASGLDDPLDEAAAIEADYAEALSGAQQFDGDLLVAPAAVRTDTEASTDVSTDTTTDAGTATTEATGEILPGSWPCDGCNTTNPMSADVCVHCGLPFLTYAKTPPRLDLPIIGDIFQRSRAQQVGFIAAAGFGVLAVLLGLMTLLGLIL